MFGPLCYMSYSQSIHLVAPCHYLDEVKSSSLNAVRPRPISKPNAITDILPKDTHL
jgi:hypothetical protein